MKILFVAIPNSIHTARWINQFSKIHETYIFPSVDSISLHPSLTHTKLLNNQPTQGFYLPRFNNFDTTVKENKIVHYFKSGINLLNLYWCQVISLIDYHKKVQQLLRIINEIHPDVIHALEMQSAGYLVDKTKRLSREKFPFWLVSIWGSDIYFFGKKNSHVSKIKSVLNNADMVLCESRRDVKLAVQFGAKPSQVKLLPSTGGFDTETIKKLQTVKPSQRKDIVVKGYQGWSGKALTAINALEGCVQLLTDKKFRLVLHSASPKGRVERAFTHLCKKHNISLHVIPFGVSHREMLKMYSQARCSISISVTDGVPNSLTESMAMGTFPIQTDTSAADEWVEDGKTAFLVSPTNLLAITRAIKKALTDDSLVDQAAVTNQKTISKRLDSRVVKARVIELYQDISAKAITV